MSSATAPYPYFNGITYNPSFFSSSSTSLTQAQANLLYLKKTTADTATALETFSGGILSNSLKTIATSDALDIATTQTSGAINIGSLPSRSGNINIGYSVSAPTGLGCNINMGNILSSTSIGGKYIELAAASSGISLTTSGTLDMIATAYNMGTSSLVATNINIGTVAKTTTSIYGTLSSNKLDGLTIGGAQTIGGNIDTGSITIGGALTTGSLTLGGVQTTGDINIGISNATTDIYIGNGTNSTTGVNTGICSINKLQVGNTTTGNGVGTGTPYRCMIIGRNVGSTSAASGSITIAGAPTGAGNPIVFASLNANTTSNPYFLSVNPTGTNTFDYYKVFYNRSGTTFSNVIVGATGETFNYVAIWL